MSEVLQTNVFFVITSIAVVAVTILIAISLYHVIRILSSLRKIIERLRKGSEVLAEDVASLHTFVKDGVIGRIARVYTGASSKKKKRRVQKKEDK